MVGSSRCREGKLAFSSFSGHTCIPQAQLQPLPGCTESQRVPVCLWLSLSSARAESRDSSDCRWYWAWISNSCQRGDRQTAFSWHQPLLERCPFPGHCTHMKTGQRGSCKGTPPRGPWDCVCSEGRRADWRGVSSGQAVCLHLVLVVALTCSGRSKASYRHLLMP